MSKQLIVCASNWPSFVASLKSNLKLNYGLCNKTEFRNGFFTASLSQGKDKSYIAKLANMSGEEKENCHELCTFLGSVYVPIPQALMDEMKEIVQKGEENKQKEISEHGHLQTEAVATTINQTNCTETTS